MKVIKYLLLAFLTLIGIALIVAAIMPKTFSAEREIVINKPKQDVFNYIKYIKNMDNYGKWQLMDPGMKKSYEGTDGTTGFVYKWDGEKTGKGSQTITKVSDGEGIETSLDFGFGEPAQSFIVCTEKSPTETVVKWGITGKSPYPMNIMSLFYDMGNDFSEGLQNLKTLMEKQ